MEGDDLDRLAEAHVVGETATEPQLAHARQPCQAPELVRPQLGDQGVRRRDRVERTARQPAETVGHIGNGTDGDEIDELAVDFELAAEQRAECFGSCDPPRPPLLRFGDELGVHSDEAAADTYEAAFCLREEVDLLRTESLATYCELVVEVQQRPEIEAPLRN